MPTTLTIADVERIAALAQLELTDEEKQTFARQLADILHYAEQVQAVDTAGVPPMAHVGSERSERNDGPLAGVPIALKDNMCVRGMRTTASSKILDNFVAPYDATVAQRLEAAGAVI